MMIAVKGLTKTSEIISGVAIYFREFILPMLWIMYWGTRECTHIKIVAIDEDHETIYQQLHHFKYTRKVVIKYYSEDMNYSISCLQNNSFTVIESSIHCIF